MSSVDQIPVRRTFYPIKQFVSWFNLKQLDLKPAYQRNFVWNPMARSYLIDSVLKGYPLPIVILRDKPGIHLDPAMEVVDGQQRLTTLISFVMPEKFSNDKQFAISKIHNETLGGKKFSELDKDLQAQILDYDLSVHLLPASVDNQEVLRIFARLNSTGISLNNQELRNAEFHGAFKTVLFDLAVSYLDFWKNYQIFSNSDIARMFEVEFSSELVIQMLRGISASNKKIIDDVYKQYDKEFPYSQNLVGRFGHCMQIIEDNLGDKLSKTEFRKTPWFYTLFGSVYNKSYQDLDSSQRPIPIAKEFWMNVLNFSAALQSGEVPDEVIKALSGRTTNAKTRRERQDLFNLYIQR